QLNRARREPEFTQTKETEIQLLSAVAGATEKEEFQKLEAELIGIYSSLWRERPADRVLDAGDRKLLRLLLKKYTPERLKAIYRLCFGFEKNSANCDESWIAKSDKSIRVFHHKVEFLEQRLRKREAWKETRP